MTASPSPARGPAQVPAADQTLAILSFLSRQRGPIAASTIATQLGLPRSTVYHLLGAMLEHRFVVHLRGERRWGLGTAAFELAGGYARQEPLARVGHQVVADLVDQVGESAHLAVMSGRDVLYIVDERAPRRPVLVADVGVRLPAHLTASGRAMLAVMPQKQVRALFPDASSFADRTGRGPKQPRELRAVLDAIRSGALASENGEVSIGMRSVGIAVLDHAGWPAAAVAVTWSEERPQDEERLRMLLEASAAEIRRRIYGG